jgi:hypothetical protein
MYMRRLFLMWLAGACGYFVQAQEPYPSGSAVPNIVKAEYFFDTDPGIGNATAIVLGPAQELNNITRTITLNGPALTNGIHRLYIRTLDELGRWSMTFSALFDNFIVPAYPGAIAQSDIVAMEYFIDTDPGIGNGTAIPVTPGIELSNQQVLINLNGLSTAAHKLYIRSKDATGKWSLTAYAVFDNAAQVPYPTAPPAPAPISQLEYFLDTDPGFGHATPVTVPAATEVTNFQFSIPLNGVAQGRHTIYIRSKGNPYSLTAYSEFMVGSALPLTWLYVKGEVQQQQHIISWATAAEVNVSHFTIEYSEDGVHYRAIVDMQAKGTDNGTASYRFVYKYPVAGWNYYRVVETDHDGVTNRSKVITLLNRETLVNTILAPNPFTDRLQVVIGAHETARRIIVYSTNGRQVMEETIRDPQQKFIELRTGVLPAGVYFVHILYTNKEATYRVIRN